MAKALCKNKVSDLLLLSQPSYECGNAGKGRGAQMSRNEDEREKRQLSYADFKHMPLTRGDFDKRECSFYKRMETQANSLMLLICVKLENSGPGTLS